MSVLLPWKREVNNEVRHRPRNNPAAPPQKRSLGCLRAALLVLGMVLASVSVVEEIWQSAAARRLRAYERIWEADRVLSYTGEYCVADKGGEMSFMGPFGRIEDLPSYVEQAVISGDRLYALDSTQLLTCDTKGKTTVLCSVTPGERLMTCQGSECAFLARPGHSGRFGEPWMLRAVSPEGEVLWDRTLPGIPDIAVATGSGIVLGLRDIAAGGVLSVMKIESATGQMRWIRPAGNGMWRDIAAAEPGLTVCATSRQALILDAAGEELWSRSLGGEVRAAALTDRAVVLAHDSPGHSLIEAFSHDGTPAWKVRLPSAPHALLVRCDSLVALCQNHVIGFSLEDGDRELYFRTRDTPLAMSGEVLLLSGSSGAYLLKVEMDGARRR